MMSTIFTQTSFGGDNLINNYCNALDALLLTQVDDDDDDESVLSQYIIHLQVHMSDQHQLDRK